MTNSKNKTPWPTKKVMEQIYDKRLWGTNGNLFYSGFGSHKKEFVAPYLEQVIHFLKLHDNKLSICDLGCGDFNIGANLVQYSSKYHAIDIVEDLIRFNKENYQSKNLEFHCLDIVKDNLPSADCVILRQVLQHLSNREIEGIVKKLKKYSFILLTEHIPSYDFVPNIDIISGQGIRIKKNSGVDITANPFKFQPKKQTEILSIQVPNKSERIVTTLFEN